MTTTVVNCRTEKYDIYIGRPSKWGNPFKIAQGHSRTRAIAQYREWIVKQPELMASLHELKDKRLGCWCKPLPCHGDVLAELADSVDEVSVRSTDGRK